VIFDIARVSRVAWPIVSTFKLGKQLMRRLAEHIDQHVNAATMSHADDHLANAVGACASHQFVHGRNEAVAAFQRKTFLADVLGVQVALDALGSGQLFQHPLTCCGIQTTAAAGALQSFIQPAPLWRIGNVHELGAD